VGTIAPDLVDRLGRLPAPAAIGELQLDDTTTLEETFVALGYLQDGYAHPVTDVADAATRLKSDYGLGYDDTIDAAFVGHLITLLHPTAGEVRMGGAPVVVDVPSADKSDDELAVAIIEHEYEILDQWDKAVEIFQVVMTSDADDETQPDFLKAAKEHFKDKALGKLAEQLPLGGEAFEVLKALEDEIKRARAADESARLRDFFVEHKQTVADMQKSLTTIKDDFRAKVRHTAEQMWSDPAKQDEYGLMRMYLVEYFDDVDRRLQAADTETFFQLLSEEWLQSAKVRSEYGIAAYVLIHVDEDFSIRKAEIKGTGGDKLADQLLKDSPGGVDVWSLRVPRRVLCYHDGGSYPYAVVKVDAEDRLTNEGTMAEGNYRPIYDWLMQNGLPPTTKLN
jgi:hypothetical protein